MSEEKDSIREKIKEQREKIRKFSSMVTMDYANKDSEQVRVGEDWTEMTPGVHSIVCSLNGDECTVINVIFSTGGMMKPHHHDRVEYVFVASGSIHETVSGKTINEGESIVIPAGESHGWKSDGAKLTVVWKPSYPRL